MATLNLLHHPLFWTLIGLFFLVSASEGINRTSGQDVTLTCRAPNNNNIIVVEWSRADLESEYVILYRDGHFVPDEQHPSFKNRVDLQDRQMKDGDVSLILKNVTINDTGTYECRVFTRGANPKKRAHLKTDPINIVYLSVVDLPDKKIITAESGQDVTLTCQVPHNNIIIVEWSRADLKTEHVLVYRDGHFVPEEQHPSFKNRVDLQDRQMKDGDVSLILKDVTINDTGTYECCSFMRETRSWKSISIIYLHVVPPGQTGGHTEDGGKEDGVSRGHFGLIAGLFFFAAVVGFLIYQAHQQQIQDSFQPPGEKQPCCYY